MAQARAGQTADDVVAETGDVQEQIAQAQAESLADVVVQLRRLQAWLDPRDEVPARLLRSSLVALEAAVVEGSRP